MAKEIYYWDIHNSTTMGLYLDSQEREIIDPFLYSNPPETVLDISCGSGRFSLPMMKKGVNVTAADMNRLPLRLLNEKTLGNEQLISLCQADGNCLPFKNNTFDCILSLQTVSYFDIDLFFSECRRVLKDCGFLLFNEANRHSYKSFVFWAMRSSPTFYHHSFPVICQKLIDNDFHFKMATGMNWVPTKRDSDNALIPLFSALEKMIHLRIFPSISPWVFYIAQKKGETEKITEREI